MIKENKKKYQKGQDDIDTTEYFNPKIEEDFSANQREHRYEMYEYLTQKNSLGKDFIPMKELVLRNCPKLTIQPDGFMQNQHDKLHRSTHYRGVSKNGRCNWQILTMIDGEKFYVGTVDDMHKAAIIYDVLSIQTKGRKAKTNFNYRKIELLAILQLKMLSSTKDKEGEGKGKDAEKDNGSVVAQQNSQNSTQHKKEEGLRKRRKEMETDLIEQQANKIK